MLCGVGFEAYLLFLIAALPFADLDDFVVDADLCVDLDEVPLFVAATLCFLLVEAVCPDAQIGIAAARRIPHIATD